MELIVKKNCGPSEEAFERFAIMTVDGGLSDEKALAYIVRNYGFQEAAKISTLLESGKSTCD